MAPRELLRLPAYGVNQSVLSAMLTRVRRSYKYILQRHLMRSNMSFRALFHPSHTHYRPSSR